MLFKPMIYSRGVGLALSYGLEPTNLSHAHPTNYKLNVPGRALLPPFLLLSSLLRSSDGDDGDPIYTWLLIDNHPPTSAWQ
jgi:hypothetical protein